jgi:hypothetical protein
MKRGDNMTVNEAAKLLKMNAQTLRCGLQQGKFPFGTAVITTPAEKSTVGKDRWTYYINDKKLNDYLEGR